MFYILCVAGEQGHSEVISLVIPSELLNALHNIDYRNNEATLKAVVRGMHAWFIIASWSTSPSYAFLCEEQTGINCMWLCTPFL